MSTAVQSSNHDSIDSNVLVHAKPVELCDRDDMVRSPWETDGEYRVRLALDEALIEWRAQGSLAPRTAMAMATELLEVCQREPHATWFALSLLEQLHSRGVVAIELFRYLNDELSCNDGLGMSLV